MKTPTYLHHWEQERKKNKRRELESQDEKGNKGTSSLFLPKPTKKFGFLAYGAGNDREPGSKVVKKSQAPLKNMS